jgi:hypothetical protein
MEIYDSSVKDATPSVANPVESVTDSNWNSTVPRLVAQEKLIENLCAFLEKERGLALFACGGVIPITDEDNTVSRDMAVHNKLPEDDESAKDDNPDGLDLPRGECVSPPVILRWDAHDGKTPCENTKLRFPLDDTTAQNLDHLLAAAEPATFGRGGQDVYDEAYRKALKVDTTKFSSTFNPYELGIIDIIAQLLLPSAIDSRTHRAVRAELYKLNVRIYNALCCPSSFVSITPGC